MEVFYEAPIKFQNLEDSPLDCSDWTSSEDIEKALPLELIQNELLLDSSVSKVSGMRVGTRVVGRQTSYAIQFFLPKSVLDTLTSDEKTKLENEVTAQITDGLLEDQHDNGILTHTVQFVPLIDSPF